jgi:uncharacterized protein YoxC
VDVETAVNMADDARIYLAGAAVDAGMISGIYESRDQFLTELKEFNMDIKQLKAEFPDVYDAIIDIGKTDAITAMEDKLERAETAATDAEARVLSVVDQVVDDATAAKIRAIIDTGVTAEQVEKLSAVFGGKEPTGVLSPESINMKAILNALKAVTPPSAPDGGDPADEKNSETKKRKEKAKALVDLAN